MPITRILARDVPASVVVFLVALPLCMGIAVASGVPPEKGLMAGIVGGIVIGVLAGSPLQVSGPAAGLAVIVYDVVQTHGLAMLGPILMVAGPLQIVAGLLKLGQWFRAISPAVVHGMLAGIGVLIVAAQVHVVTDGTPLPGGLENLLAIPGAFGDMLAPHGAGDLEPLAVGLVTVAAMLGWERWRPAPLRLVPGALVGLAAGMALALGAGLAVKMVEVPASLLTAVAPPSLSDFGRMAEPGLIATALTIALIASAETLISAAAVDRMHNGPRTLFNRELFAQGVGNTMCGAIGALPMTGVIVRSSANVQAGAVSRLSAILHGLWILILVALAPGLLHLVPTAALAGILIVTGWRLVNLDHAREMLHRYGWLPAAVWAVTLAVVVSVDLLTGVLAGFLMTFLQVVPHLRQRLIVRQRQRSEESVDIRLAGTATFLQLPRLSEALEAVPDDKSVILRTERLGYLDHTCVEMIGRWAEQRAAAGRPVRLRGTRGRHQRQLAAALPD